MDAIEKRARELLAAEYMLSLSGAGPKQRHLHACAVRAIIAALTPPEGYVLAPVEPTAAMTKEGHYAIPFEPDSPAADPKVAHDVWAAMLAARPEVP